MSIRIPKNGDQEILNAFADVEQWLRDLEAAQKTVTDLGRKVEALQAQVDTPVVAPTFTQLGDTVITGDLRVEGSTNVRGNFTAPQALDGLVVATPSGTGDASAAQRVVEVHASLAVLNALSAETGRFRNLQVTSNMPSASPKLFYYDAATSVKTTNDEDFYTHTINANTLSVNDTLEYTCYADAANATAVNIGLVLRFAGTNLAFGQAGSTVNPTRLFLRALVTITAAATQQSYGEQVNYNGAAGTGVPYLAATTMAGDTATPITASIRLGASGGTRTVTAYGLTVKHWKAS